MAWDPNSSSWEWDAEGVILPSHVNGIDLRKPAASDWPSNTELCPIKPDGSLTHTSRQLCSSGERSGTTSQGVHMDVTKHESMLTNRVVTPVMANMHASLVFDGAGGPGNVVSMGQGRVPIVTTCIGGGAFTGCIDHGNGSLESVVRKGLLDNQGNGEPIHSPAIKATRKHLGFPHDKQQLSFAQDKQQSSSGQDKPCVVKSNGRDHLIAPKHTSNKCIDSFCNGNGKIAAEEQHSGKAMGSAGSGDSLTGLQLGKRTYSLDNTTPAVAKAIPKLNKKARASAAAMQIPRCQVEGCKLDLTTSKDYHRRHKVCEPHSKARKVIVASQEQRFCQQCSRFHILTEFDEAKRSCRRRLAGHNKRRRKPQPDPLELQARLRSTLADWSFLHQSRYSRQPFWQDAGDYRSSGLWSRKITHYNDPPTYDYTLQSLGTDAYMKGPSSSVTHDKFPLLLLQSPKSMMPMDTCDSRAHHQYLPGLVGGLHMGNGLSLASSSLGAGVFAGLETPPIMEVARVSDSGRALSLLSLHSQCSQAPDMVPLDLSGLASSTIDNDQHVQEDAIASQHFLLQGRDQYSCHDFSTTLSMTSNVHLPSTVNVHEVASEKEFYECSFLDNLNRQNGYDESHPMVMNMQVHEATDQGKQTQDLMQIASFQMPTAASQRPVMVFQPERSPMGDSQFSHETSFLKF